MPVPIQFHFRVTWPLHWLNPCQCAQKDVWRTTTNRVSCRPRRRQTGPQDPAIEVRAQVRFCINPYVARSGLSAFVCVFCPGQKLRLAGPSSPRIFLLFCFHIMLSPVIGPRHNFFLARFGPVFGPAWFVCVLCVILLNSHPILWLCAGEEPSPGNSAADDEVRADDIIPA